MRILTAIEVKKRLQHIPGLQLVMTLSPAAFAKCHIPGSINIWTVQDAKTRFSLDTPIILYCSDTTCMASYQAYVEMEEAGFTQLWRFAGGLVAWADAGFSLSYGASSFLLEEFLQQGNL